MALGSVNGNSNRIYLRCANGKFVQQVATPIEGSVARTTKPNAQGETRTVHEVMHDHVDGLIMGVTIKESTYLGEAIKTIELEMADNGENYVITMRHDSAYATSFLNALTNVRDFTKNIRVFVWTMKNDERPDRPFTGITLYAVPGDKTTKVAKAFVPATKMDTLAPDEAAKVKAMPDVAKGTYKGKPVTDNTEQVEFLIKNFTDNIEPLIKKAKSFNAINAGADNFNRDTAPASAPAHAEDAGEEFDDVPF